MYLTYLVQFPDTDVQYVQNIKNISFLLEKNWNNFLKGNPTMFVWYARTLVR